MNQPMNEFSLIQHLTKQLSQYSKEVIAGIGDDCAVLSQNDNVYLLATCDSQVSHVHFLPDNVAPEQIGQKAIAVNVSDIVSMGGKATFCLVSLIIPSHLEDSYIEGVYEGIKNTCKMYDIQIIGGNISKGKELVIDIFMLGEVKRDKLIRRSGAKPGDKALVTGTLGDARTGLELLRNKKMKVTDLERKQLLVRQCTPSPRVKESQIIAESKRATAMIDVSDGLSSDIQHICDQSNVGVVILEKNVPMTQATKKIAKQLGKKATTLALEGGEDYELLFTAPPHAVESLIAIIKQKTGTEVTVIGEILPKEKGRWIQLENGQRKKLLSKGWNHRA